MEEEGSERLVLEMVTWLVLATESVEGYEVAERGAADVAAGAGGDSCDGLRFGGRCSDSL